MKYQCNSCGVVYENRSSAVNCHPDINEIPDEELESRLAAQQSVQADGADICPHCGRLNKLHCGCNEVAE